MAVGVANNHALDDGLAAYEAMRRHLQGAGVAALEHGRSQDVVGFRLLALRDFDNPPRRGRELIGDAELNIVAALARDGSPPLVVMPHWGREFIAELGSREQVLAEGLAKAGAQWIVGAHPHRASSRLIAIAKDKTVVAYSLGNFAFDQRAPHASGAVLQISCFADGACATRLVPMPGIYELGR